jgi:hypothetical protein
MLDSLADYERDRNAAAMPLYRENIHFAQFKPVPENVLALRAAVRGNQEQTDRFYLARQQMIPREEFFNPENLRRLNLGSSRSAQTGASA